MADTTIEVQHVTKRYGAYTAVEDVSFTVARGETVGLLGTNGSGKTTTMRVLTGYMPPTSGRVAVCGFDAASNSLEMRRHVGYLPESAALYGDMTVSGSLRFFGKLRGMSGETLADRVEHVISALGLDDYRDTLVAKLSKGFRQRAAFAHALLHDPDVLILDEPTASIDPIQVIEIRELIRSLGAEHTILLSTHQLHEASALCDRVVILHEGSVIAEGSPEALAASLPSAPASLEDLFVQLTTPGGEA